MPERDASGRFKPGTSGNPKGRSVSRRKSDAAIRAQLSKSAPEIVQRIIDAALEGDMQAAKLVLERTSPALKPTDSAVDIPQADTLTGTATAVLAAVTSGDISPTQGATLAGIIANTARVTEVDELIRRIEALEAKA